MTPFYLTTGAFVIYAAVGLAVLRALRARYQRRRRRVLLTRLAGDMRAMTQRPE